MGNNLTNILDAIKGLKRGKRSKLTNKSVLIITFIHYINNNKSETNIITISKILKLELWN